jgi:Zn2+/Cd2+-exporting ATPase
MQLIKQHFDSTLALVCGLLIGGGYVAMQSELISLALILWAGGYLVGGYQNAIEGLTTLWQERELDVDLLMIVAAMGAAVLGIWKHEYALILDGGVLILIFALSGALESYAVGSTERNIHSLMNLTTDLARRMIGGKEEQVAIDRLNVGDVLLIKPGELIPTDGEVISGITTIDRAAITGESIPVDTQVGDRVFGGTLNGNGVLTIRVDRSPQSSLIQRIIKLVQQAQTEIPPSQQRIEKFERGYAKAIVIIGLLLGTLPPFILNWDWETTIYRALIFLVVASPCALMSAIMPALLSGIARGAREGILFKSGGMLEQIARVNAIAYDKTGTLTIGKLQLVDLITVGDMDSDRLLALAASVESGSEHPIGKAICAAAIDRSLDVTPAGEIVAQPGLGISGKVGDLTVTVGRARSIPNLDLTPYLPLVAELDRAGKTIVWVVTADRVCGAIALADTLRPEAKDLVAAIDRLGIPQIILTGDSHACAESIAQELGIKRIYAELLPTDKVDLIKMLQTEYQQVAMVGDGINDAPALAVANVGMAMGKTGTDVALETADVVLMADDLAKIERAIRLGKSSQTIVSQNIIFALSSIGILLGLNLWGAIDLPQGVLGHEGSTVLVTLSGLRLLK